MKMLQKALPNICTAALIIQLFLSFFAGFPKRYFLVDSSAKPTFQLKAKMEGEEEQLNQAPKVVSVYFQLSTTQCSGLVYFLKYLAFLLVVGFIYTFWQSLSSTSSILEQRLQSVHHLQMTSSEGFQHHFKTCLLWLLHKKECSLFTYLF